MKFSAIFTAMISLAAANSQFQEIQDRFNRIVENNRNMAQERLNSIMNKCDISADGATAQALQNAWETQGMQAVLAEIEKLSNSAQVSCLRNEVEAARSIECFQKVEIFQVLSLFL